MAFRSRSWGRSRFKLENADRQNFSKEEQISDFELVCLKDFLSSVSAVNYHRHKQSDLGLTYYNNLSNKLLTFPSCIYCGWSIEASLLLTTECLSLAPNGRTCRQNLWIMFWKNLQRVIRMLLFFCQSGCYLLETITISSDSINNKSQILGEINKNSTNQQNQTFITIWKAPRKECNSKFCRPASSPKLLHLSALWENKCQFFTQINYRGETLWFKTTMLQHPKQIE